MKGLDTPALLALLEGTPSSRSILESPGAGELCTTEINMFELEVLARSRRSRSVAREAALDRLRHKITVLPVDARGARLAGRTSERNPRYSPLDCLVVGTLAAHGVEEILTADPGMITPVGLKVRVTRLSRSASKSDESRSIRSSES